MPRRPGPTPSWQTSWPPVPPIIEELTPHSLLPRAHLGDRTDVARHGVTPSGPPARPGLASALLPCRRHRPGRCPAARGRDGKAPTMGVTARGRECAPDGFTGDAPQRGGPARAGGDRWRLQFEWRKRLGGQYCCAARRGSQRTAVTTAAPRARPMSATPTFSTVSPVPLQPPARP